MSVNPDSNAAKKRDNGTMSTQPRSAVFQAAGESEELTLIALKKAANLLREHPATVIEIVVSGSAVHGLIDGHATAVAAAILLGDHPSTTVVACRNALHTHDIDESALADTFSVVPAAVARIAERQWDGWALVVV